MKKQIHKNQFENGQRFLGIDKATLTTHNSQLTKTSPPYSASLRLRILLYPVLCLYGK